MTNFANHFPGSHFSDILPITSTSPFIDRQTQLRKLRSTLLSDMSAKRELYLDKVHNGLTGGGVVTPHQHDILCGRGGGSCKNMGNFVFRNLIAANKEMYLSSTRREKIAITQSIVAAICHQNPPGRFLEKDEATGRWKDIGAKRSLKKVSQSLREGAPHLRKKMKVGNNTTSGTYCSREGDSQRYKHRLPVQISHGFGPTKRQHAPGSTMNKPSSLMAHHHGSRFLQNTAVGADLSQTVRKQIFGPNALHDTGRKKIELRRTSTPKSSSSSEASAANEEFQGDDKHRNPISDDVGSIDWINVFQALSDDDTDEDLQGAVSCHPTSTKNANEDSNSGTVAPRKEAEDLKPSPPLTTSQLPATPQEHHKVDRNESEVPAIMTSYSTPPLRMHPLSDKAAKPSHTTDQEQSPPSRVAGPDAGWRQHAAVLPQHPNSNAIHNAAGSWTSYMESSAIAFGCKEMISTAANASGGTLSTTKFTPSSYKHANPAFGIGNPFRFNKVHRWRSSNESVLQGSSSSSESDESKGSRCVSCGRHTDCREEMQLVEGNSSAQHDGAGVSNEDALGANLCQQLRSFETSWRAAEREKALLRGTLSACKDANQQKIMDLSKRHAAEVARLRLELKMVTDQLKEELKKGQPLPCGDSKKRTRAGSAA